MAGQGFCATQRVSGTLAVLSDERYQNHPCFPNLLTFYLLPLDVCLCFLINICNLPFQGKGDLKKTKRRVGMELLWKEGYMKERTLRKDILNVFTILRFY